MAKKTTKKKATAKHLEPGIHIRKAQKPGTHFWVIVVGENSEVLSQSEVLTSQANAHKNIIAQAKAFGITTAKDLKVFAPDGAILRLSF